MDEAATLLNSDVNETLQEDDYLGRLESPKIDGDTNGDGDIDEIHIYGGRSFSIFDDQGKLVYDSGDAIGKLTAALVPGLFNSDDGDPAEFDTRSDAKGAEPEAVTLATIAGETYAFVGLERTGGVMIFNISDPTDVQFVDYIIVPGDIAPEGLTIIPAEDSPSGEVILAISSEGSSTISLVEILGPPQVNESNVSITAANAVQNEGDTGTTDFTFTVTRTGGTNPVSVNFEVMANGVDAADFGGTLPSGTIDFDENEMSKTLTITVSGVDVIEGHETFTVILSSSTSSVTIETATAQGTILDDETVIATGSNPGELPRILVSHSVTGRELANFLALDQQFTGGVLVEHGDVNGDGAIDLVVAAGPGGGPHIRVLDGFGMMMVSEFMAYDAMFTGGVDVAIGDVNNDGSDDIITGAGPGGGPHVRAFDGSDPSNLLADYFAYDINFTGGVRVAAGDINNDGFDDIITGAGPGGGPHVKVFSGEDQTELESFFPFNPNFTGGVDVASMDFDSDGIDDIVVAINQDRGIVGRILDGADPTRQLSSFFFEPGNPSFNSNRVLDDIFQHHGFLEDLLELDLI